MAPLSARTVPLNDGGLAIVVINILLAVVATTACVGRFWARKLTGLNWSWDDWLALASLIVNHVFMAVTVNASFHGLGQSLAVLLAESPESVVVFLKVCLHDPPPFFFFFFHRPQCILQISLPVESEPRTNTEYHTQCVLAAEFSYGISSPLIKLALLAFYWRMFPTDHVKKGVIVLSAACILWLLAIFIINILECRPVHYLWDQLAEPGTGTCLDLVLYFLCNAVANSIIDILTLLLPIREVMKLQMSKSKKVGICCVFGLGSAVVVASLVRLGSLADLLVVGVTDLTRE